MPLRLSEFEAMPTIIIVAGLYVLVLGVWTAIGRLRPNRPEAVAEKLPTPMEAPKGASQQVAQPTWCASPLKASLLSSASPQAVAGVSTPTDTIHTPTPMSSDPVMVAPGGVLCPRYFLKTYTRHHAGSRLGASVLYAVYISRAQRLKLHCVTQIELGRTARILGWKKIKSSSIYYRDKAFVWQ